MVRLAWAGVVLWGCLGIACGPLALASTAPGDVSATANSAVAVSTVAAPVAAAPAVGVPAVAQTPATDQAPVTEPPVTEPPVTTAPAVPTLPATTPAETTPPQVVTVAPTTEAPVPTQPVQPATTTGSSNSVLLWVVIGLAALVVIGVIIWLVTASARRSDQVAAWQARRRNAYAEGAALHDAVMSATGQLGRLAPAEEAARWADVQRRADDFTQRLYQLRETAPDETGAARTDDVLVSLQALRSAVDAERTAGTQAGMTAEVTRTRLGEFRASLHALRAAY